MEEVDVKMQFRALAKYMLVFSELLDRLAKLETEGFPISKLRDQETWSKLGELMIRELSKENFLRVMEIFYDLGKLTEMDPIELPLGEKNRIKIEMKERAEELLKLIGD